MRLTDKDCFSKYQVELGETVQDLFDKNSLGQKEITLDFRIKTSAVYSANIEGNSVDLNSFMNSEISKESFKPRKEIEEIEDLVAAYKFAIENSLNEQNLLKAHDILSKSILIADKRGKYRTDRMGVFDNNGLVYFAVEPEKVKQETKIFFEDLNQIIQSKLSITETFYFASMAHMKMAHIHPFWDGNGRASRLLEKWVLAEKLGMDAWKIQSEQFYKSNIKDYYRNINLGMDYYSLNYDLSIPFLKMLTNSLVEN